MMVRILLPLYCKERIINIILCLSGTTEDADLLIITFTNCNSFLLGMVLYVIMFG